jgi:hypothetical protein
MRKSEFFEFGSRNAEVGIFGIRNVEFGSRNCEECGSRDAEVGNFGMRTRRRPIGRDYAAAKDSEVGIF